MESEDTLYRADGNRHLLSIRFPLFSLDNVIQGICTQSSDITDRKRAEEEHVAHLGFLESLERVDRAFRQAVSLEGMLADVLDATLSIYSCDRAWLVYP